MMDELFMGFMRDNRRAPFQNSNNQFKSQPMPEMGLLSHFLQSTNQKTEILDGNKNPEKSYAPGIFKAINKSMDNVEVKETKKSAEMKAEVGVVFNPFAGIDLQKLPASITVKKERTVQESALKPNLSKYFENIYSNEGSNDQFQQKIGAILLHADKDLQKYANQFRLFKESFTGEVFEDPEFPATKESILGFGMENEETPKDSSAAQLNSKRIDWLRASEFMKNVQVIVEGISPSDIFQGNLGNCYFLSSISAIAERPERIQRLLLQKEYAENGLYGVCLNINGVWRVYNLDDRFPTSFGKVLFSHSAHAELWAMLLEKAYAKAYKGYWNTGTGGFAEEAMKDLTGAPSEYVLISNETNKDDLWKKIYTADQKQFILAAGSKGSGEKKSPMGIIQGHAYTIISANLFEGDERVLEMRNPWGDENEWKGRWSDSDDAWNDVLREQYKMTVSKPDGRFFIPYNDFLEHFEQVSFCYYHDDYILTSFEDETAAEYTNCYKFNIETAGEYYFILSQMDNRAFAGDGNGNEMTYSCNGIFAVHVCDGRVNYIGGKHGEQREVWIKANVMPGEIYLFLFTNWKYPNITKKFGLGVYGVAPIKFEKVIDTEATPKKQGQIFLESIIDKANDDVDDWNRMADNGLFSKIFSQFEHSNIGFGFYAFRNESDRNIVVTLTMKNCENVAWCKQYY